jgi:hypothetical protein
VKAERLTSLRPQYQGLPLLRPPTTTNTCTSTLKSRMSASASSLHEAATYLHDAVNHLAGKHSRVSLLVAAAATAVAAAAAVGSGSMAVPAPWDEAVGSFSATLHSSSLGSRPNPGASAPDLFGSAFLASLPDPRQFEPASARTTPSKVATAVNAKVADAKAAAKAPQPHASKGAANPRPSKPYLVYDSVWPSTLPSGQAAAVYADGTYAVRPSQVAGRRSLLWIDTNGSDPSANVLDVEPGDSTPATAAHWVATKLTRQSHSVAIVYTMLSDWQAVKDAIGSLPPWMQSHVRYWIADPTGVPHTIPGSSATQWYWGSRYDISTANPNFER